jgi:hypothetical protein
MGVLLFILGLAVALGSQPIVKWFVQWVRKESGVPTDREGEGVPPWIVGTFERLLAFALIFFNVEQASTLSLGWPRSLRPIGSVRPWWETIAKLTGKSGYTRPVVRIPQPGSAPGFFLETLVVGTQCCFALAAGTVTVTVVPWGPLDLWTVALS